MVHDFEQLYMRDYSKSCFVLISNKLKV